MFCGRCGTQNNDNNINCANCGAPLRPAQQQPQYSYVQPQPQYGAPARVGAKPTVLYIIAGVMGALQVLMFFLPHLALRGGDAIIPIQIIAGEKITLGLGSDFVKVVEISTYFLIILIAIELAWAVLSFLQKKPAGIFGVVACAIGFFVHMIWMIFMLAYGSESGINMTPFPVFMYLISIAGIPVSIIQIVKSKYLA